MKEMPVRKKTHPVDEGNPPPAKRGKGGRPLWFCSQAGELPSAGKRPLSPWVHDSDLRSSGASALHTLKRCPGLVQSPLPLPLPPHQLPTPSPSQLGSSDLAGPQAGVQPQGGSTAHASLGVGSRKACTCWLHPTVGGGEAGREDRVRWAKGAGKGGNQGLRC